jgi:hypothetical protein
MQEGLRRGVPSLSTPVKKSKYQSLLVCLKSESESEREREEEKEEKEEKETSLFFFLSFSLDL